MDNLSFNMKRLCYSRLDEISVHPVVKSVKFSAASNLNKT